MTLVWYVLIHVSLGVIGKDHFTFTNLGALYCAAAALPVQGYAAAQLHRAAWPKFQAGLDPASAPEAARAARRGYWSRLGRILMFRVSAFGVLTLLIASLLRGAEG